jgi:hypothetical protein
MGKQKRVRIELVPREQPDIALYVHALLITAREQPKPASVKPSVPDAPAEATAAGEVPPR